MQDEAYYARSGGGVTLSGGEVLLQPAFALDLLRALRARGVHTAIESNLNVPFSVLEPLLPELDLVMCDLKTWTTTCTASTRASPTRASRRTSRA